MGYEGKAEALVALGRPDEAKRVLDDALAKARSQQKRGHEAQLLIVLGKLAEQNGNKQEAIANLEDAGQFAARVQFYRMEADAMFELAKLYRDSGDLATADARATQGLAASQRVGDRYYVPRNLTILADLKARRGRIAEAKALYKHAEDVIDGMLGGDDSYWNSSIAAAMSQTYLEHFELVAKEGDTAGAFQILERVRGRTLASALEDRKAAPRSGSAEAATLDSYVADTQTRLMQTNSPVEREQLLDALAEYEWRLRLAWNEGDQRFPINPSPLTQVQESLTSDETLLEYVLVSRTPSAFPLRARTQTCECYRLAARKSKNWSSGTLMKSVQKRPGLKKRSNCMRSLCNRFLRHLRENDSSLCRTAY